MGGIDQIFANGWTPSPRKNPVTWRLLQMSFEMTFSQASEFYVWKFSPNFHRYFEHNKVLLKPEWPLFSWPCHRRTPYFGLCHGDTQRPTFLCVTMHHIIRKTPTCSWRSWKHIYVYHSHMNMPSPPPPSEQTNKSFTGVDRYFVLAWVYWTHDSDYSYCFQSWMIHAKWYIVLQNVPSWANVQPMVHDALIMLPNLFTPYFRVKPHIFSTLHPHTTPPPHTPDKAVTLILIFHPRPIFEKKKITQRSQIWWWEFNVQCTHDFGQTLIFT